MNFEEFKQQLMEDLKEALSRRVGTEIAVEENEVHKLQQESYDGIVIRKENESIGVNVDATRLYSDLEQGRAYEDVLRYAVDIAQKGFEDAMMSAPQIEAPSMKTLFETTAEIMGEDFFELMGEVEPAMPGVYVCTNESKHHGASVLMYPDFMDEVADKLGGDFYIIPSSIHETLLFPAKDVENYHDLEAMVREVNETQVAPEERLSDNVYHYDAEAKVFVRKVRR